MYDTRDRLPVEYALFKKSNGHQVTAPVRLREAADPRLYGLRPGRYELRKRTIRHDPWETA